MIDFLTKLFIKNSQDVESAEVRHKYGTFGSVVGILANFILFTFKFLAGLLSASVAIMADAINNLSDAGSSVVSLVSFKLASKPADKDHPFGHARIEYIASMIVAFLILGVGVSFLTDSFGKIFSTEAVNLTVGTLTIVILSVSIIFKLLLSLFYKKLGKKINSSVMMASSLDSLLDSVSTIAVLLSAIIVKLTKLVIIDAIVGLSVSILIIVAGIRIVNETKNSLLGEAPTEDLVKSIKEITTRYPEIIGIHDMLVHSYGPGHCFASFHAEVDGKKDIFLLHDYIDNAEKQIADELGIFCTIHMDPIVTDDETINKMKSMIEKICIDIDPDISIHDFRMVVGATHSNLIFDIAIPFESKKRSEEVTLQIEKNVKLINENYYCVITVDRV